MDHSRQSLIDQYGATRVTVRLLDDLSGGAVLGTGMSLSEAVVVASLYHHTSVSIAIHTDEGDIELGREKVASLVGAGEHRSSGTELNV